jgi:hypothetical protein
MKMPRRTPSIDDFLTTLDSHKNEGNLFTDRTSARSIAFKSYEDASNKFAQELYYKKLYNINQKKVSQLVELEEAIRLISTLDIIENNPVFFDFDHKTELESKILEFEKKIASDSEYQNQLQKMIKREQNNIVLVS